MFRPPLDVEPLIGKRFGQLIILGRGTPAGKETTVDAQCDCGQVTTKRWGSIHSGNTKSCGCLTRLDVHALVGTRYGQLVVVGPAPPRGGRTCVEVICDCGQVTTVRTENLRGGRTRSCGCLVSPRRPLKRGRKGLAPRVQRPVPSAPTSTAPAQALPRGCTPSPVGQSFGRLVVVAEVPRPRGRTQVVCQCSCGQLLIKGLLALHTTKDASCGCGTLDQFSALRQASPENLRSLTEPQRQMVAMLREGLRPVQIARVRSVAKPTVTIALRRARARLLALAEALRPLPAHP